MWGSGFGAGHSEPFRPVLTAAASNDIQPGDRGRAGDGLDGHHGAVEEHDAIQSDCPRPSRPHPPKLMITEIRKASARVRAVTSDESTTI